MFKVKFKYIVLFFTIILSCDRFVYAQDVEFNTSLLDINDKESIDSGIFRQSGYILPGEYMMQVIVNNTLIGERKLRFYDFNNTSQLCLTKSLIGELRLKDTELERFLATQPINGQRDCYNPDELSGIVIKSELNKDKVTIAVPQSYQEYFTEYWDAPSLWEDGINGVLLDYAINLRENRTEVTDSTDFSAFGVAGVNLGVWRFRGDWQSRYEHKRNKNDQDNTSSNFNLTRVYGYRAYPKLKAKLILGEQDMANSVFDSFQFTGASLNTDDQMLPPNLRGYAPEVVGIAKTNAKVIISQQGRVLYETQVASGPFRIQEISSAVTGTLDVKVEEQDGSVQTFQVNVASIPYLARPGSFRYKFNGGKASRITHKVDGPAFISGEFSWGADNDWSLFGGALFSENYNALSVGIGRDLFQFGALSVDVTQSYAHLDDGNKIGSSYRINYSKNFEQYNSQLAFTGYRFLDSEFMTMNEFLGAKYSNELYRGGAKEVYSVVLSKQFHDAQLGGNIDYTHQSNWDQTESDRISLSLSHSFNLMDWRGLSASLSAYRNQQTDQVIDNGLYFSLSVPLGQQQSLSYSASSNTGKMTNSMSYHNKVDERNSYSITASTSQTGESASGFYTYTGDKNTLMANVSHFSGQNTSVGLSLYGGITATDEGAAIHKVSRMGSSRILVDTDGTKNVPINSRGTVSYTDKHGKAVIADASNYYRQRTSIDVNELSEDAEPIGTPILMGTLTEGAIGYRHFDMLSGEKRMVELVKIDGAPIPFATEVFNEKKQYLGMVGDDGMAYLAGLHSGSVVEARWGSDQYCRMQLPLSLPSADSMIKLMCQK